MDSSPKAGFVLSESDVASLVDNEHVGFAWPMVASRRGRDKGAGCQRLVVWILHVKSQVAERASDEEQGDRENKESRGRGEQDK